MQAPHLATTKQYDLIIIGAGPIGLALAGLIFQRSALLDYKIAIIDKGQPSKKHSDPRAIALSYGSKLIIDSIGWPRQTTPIQHIYVSKQGQFGQTQLHSKEYKLPALGYVCRYGDIVEALYQPLQHAKIDWYLDSSANNVQQYGKFVLIDIEQNNQISTLSSTLLVNAEGGLFHDLTQKYTTDRYRDYQQTALISTLKLPKAPAHTAWERFTDEGPLALLPLNDHEQTFSLVWCCADEKAKQRQQLSNHDFCKQFSEAFAYPIGPIEHYTQPVIFPLGLSVHPQRVASNIIQVGNAAQILHPVTGQGMNLGFRDVATLVECLSKFGLNTTALDHFIRQRNIDRKVTITLTDSLARLFTLPIGPLSPLRSFGLSILQIIPPLKHALAKQMLYGQR